MNWKKIIFWVIIILMPIISLVLGTILLLKYFLTQQKISIEEEIVKYVEEGEQQSPEELKKRLEKIKAVIASKP